MLSPCGLLTNACPIYAISDIKQVILIIKGIVLLAFNTFLIPITIIDTAATRSVVIPAIPVVIRYSIYSLCAFLTQSEPVISS